MVENKTHETLGHVVVVGALVCLPYQWGVFVALCLQFIGIGARLKEQRAIKNEQNALKTTHAKGSWWQILGVEETASIEDCLYVRKLLTEIYHPNYGKAPNAAMMARINKAHNARVALNIETNGKPSTKKAKEKNEQKA
jgi:hypothetical protein